MMNENEKKLLAKRIAIIGAMYDGIVEVLTTRFNYKNTFNTTSDTDKIKIDLSFDFSNKDSELVNIFDNITNNIMKKTKDVFSLYLTDRDTLDFYLKDFLFEKFGMMLKSDILSNIRKQYFGFHIRESDFYFYNKDKSELIQMIEKNSALDKNWNPELFINHLVNLEKTIKLEIYSN